MSQKYLMLNLMQSKRSCCPKLDAIKNATADIVSLFFPSLLFHMNRFLKSLFSLPVSHVYKFSTWKDDDIVEQFWDACCYLIQFVEILP